MVFLITNNPENKIIIDRNILKPVGEIDNNLNNEVNNLDKEII